MGVRRRAKPQIPNPVRRHGIWLLRALDALQPERAARPVVYLLTGPITPPRSLTEQAGPSEAWLATAICVAIPFARHFRHAPRFVDRVGQRF